uniref:Uncharacterized protein n=1 Tax=Anopheles darlingi TaxID=43151 RepID=A0A2M4D463_ANODA
MLFFILLGCKANLIICFLLISLILLLKYPKSSNSCPAGVQTLFVAFGFYYYFFFPKASAVAGATGGAFLRQTNGWRAR